MRFHVLGIPHTVANKTYVACAFTQLIIRFCYMLKKSSTKNNFIYFYGHEKSEVHCDELIPITDDKYLEKYYGIYDENKLIKYGDAEAENEYSQKCITEIQKRKQPKDFLLSFWGYSNKKVTDNFPDCITVEPGVGYPTNAIYANFRVFVSYAWMHFSYGKMNIDNGPWYDTVIPNYFDPDEFEYKEEKSDYILYLGRVIKAKGVDICVQLAEELGVKLIIAGQNDLKSMGYDKIPPNVELVGHAGVEKRKQLMSNAKCLLLPSYYFEPFGNVVIESMLSGTPVITTDWGAFAEINLHGTTGYRCRTFEQFAWAVKNIDKIKPINCRNWAIKNYSMDRVSKLYDEYFDMLQKQHTKNGFYEKNPERDELDWLNKYYPDN
ncbi:MAG: hypothetical protein Terrestrivirus16_2 [Terrestrivirus sp.]|uniref:Glycosyl transferase family 1 domain-containing protein n=1 Tax=Terrestrivirus sp. TaxID=2487775 RepID=A0A3G4ZPF3_9VIRU|nr:MAG: hypothetical protein Terrestrivirus16_2 [Terrestrivirus sp.]